MPTDSRPVSATRRVMSMVIGVDGVWHRVRQRAMWVILALLIALLLARAPLKLAVVGVGGAGFLILALIWPPIAFPALALAVPFGPTVPLGGFSVGATDLLVGLVVGVWLARGLAHRHLTWPRAPLVWPLLLYLAAQGLSLRTAWSLSAALPELVKWVEITALYLATVALLDGRRKTQEGRASFVVRRELVPSVIALSLIIAAALEALLGLAQFVLRIGPPQFIILGRFLRAYGTFHQPNPYAGYLGLVLPLALSLALHSVSVVPRSSFVVRLPPSVFRSPPSVLRSLSSLFRLLLYPLLAGVILAGLLASWSRGGWLGMAAGIGVVVTLRSRRAAILSGLLLFLLMAGIVLGVVGALPPSVQARFQGLEDWTLFLRPVELRSIRVTGENFALVERMAHWWAAYAMWVDHPFTGVGVGNYPVAYETYRMPGWKEPLGHAHNILLNVMAETGLVGLLAYTILWGWVFVYGLIRVRRTQGLARALVIGALGGLAHLTVHNLFDNLYVHGMYAYVAVLMGLLEVGD